MAIIRSLSLQVNSKFTLFSQYGGHFGALYFSEKIFFLFDGNLFLLKPIVGLKKLLENYRKRLDRKVSRRRSDDTYKLSSIDTK